MLKNLFRDRNISTQGYASKFLQRAIIITLELFFDVHAEGSTGIQCLSRGFNKNKMQQKLPSLRIEPGTSWAPV